MTMIFSNLLVKVLYGSHPDIIFLIFYFKIRDFVKEVQDELSKPGFNSFGLGDCKAPKVLGDIVESIAGAIFLDSGRDTAVVWKVSFTKRTQPLLLNLLHLVASSFLLHCRLTNGVV